MSEEKFTVSWMMVDEKMIKFKEVDEAYDLSDSVVTFVKKNKLHEREEIQVEVEINKSEGENGTVTSLKEVGGTQSPKEEAKEETLEVEENLTIKEMTVAGVSVSNKGVTFKEEEKIWYTLDDSINPQEFKDKYTKRVVEVSVRKTDKGNDVIVAFTVKEEETTEDTSKDESPENEPKKGSTYQRSIEAQASLKCAKVIVASMVTPESKPDFVKKLITGIAEHSYETLQNLKNKE